MSKLRIGLVLAVAAVGVVAVSAVTTLNAQKKTAAVIVSEPQDTGGPLTMLAEGPDQVGTLLGLGGPQIGVQIRDVADDEVSKLKLPAAGGVVVESVSSGTPAEKAGVKAGDIITEFDGERIRSVAHLTRLVRESAEGRAVKMMVWRDGKRMDLTVTPAATGSALWASRGEDSAKLQEQYQKRLDEVMPKLERELPRLRREYRFDTLPEGRSFRFVPRGESGDTFSLLLSPGQGRLGIGVEDLTEQLATYFGTKDGVLVRSVDDGSPAAKAGIKAGDVITSVNGETVNDVDDLLSRLAKAEDGAEVTIGLVRDRKPLSLKARLEARKPVTRRFGRGVAPEI